MCGGASSLQVLWPAAAQGPGGFPHASHKGAAEGTENFVHKGRVCRLGLSLSVNGGLQLLAQRQLPDLVDRGVRYYSRGHRPGRGFRVFGWPLCLAPCGSGSRERRVRWNDGSGFGAATFSVAGGSRGSGKRVPRPGDVGGGRLVFGRVRHHGLLRLASTLWVSVARAGQVDVLPAGVPDRQALLECVARPRVVGLYEGVLLGEAGSPGVVVVYGRLGSRWCDVYRRVLRWEEVIPRPSCCLLPCVWLVRDSRRACVVVRRRCRSCGRLRLRALGGFPGVARGRCGGH